MKKREEEKERNKLKVRPNNLFSMEYIEVSSPTLVLTKRFMFDCPSFKSKEWVWFGVFNKVNYISSKSFSIKFFTRLLSWDW